MYESTREGVGKDHCKQGLVMLSLCLSPSRAVGIVVEPGVTGHEQTMPSKFAHHLWGGGVKKASVYAKERNSEELGGECDRGTLLFHHQSTVLFKVVHIFLNDEVSSHSTLTKSL